jgi:hypothetical protein
MALQVLENTPQTLTLQHFLLGFFGGHFPLKYEHSLSYFYQIIFTLHICASYKCFLKL